MNEALKLRDELAAATGYDKAGSSSKQSASSRGFGTEMTHEDTGELSGRFTAVYESNLRVETAEQQQTVAITELRGSIGSLTSQVTGLYNIADETRTILAQFLSGVTANQREHRRNCQTLSNRCRPTLPK